MAIVVKSAVIEGQSSSVGNPTYSITYSIASTTAGNAIVIVIATDNSISRGVFPNFTPTDNKSNTYHLIGSATGSGVYQINASAYIAYNIAAATTAITVLSGGICCCGSTWNAQIVNVYEISGLGTTNPIDVFNSTVGYQNTVTNVNVTNSQANAIIIGARTENAIAGYDPSNMSIDSGFTACGSYGDITPGGGSVAAIRGEYQIVSTTASRTISLPVTGGTAGNSAALVGFSLANGGHAVTNPNSSFMAFF